jgi:hypothetical protein
MKEPHFLLILLSAAISGDAQNYPPDRVLVKPLNPDAAIAFHQNRGNEVLRTLSRIGGIQVVKLPVGVRVEDAVARCTESRLFAFAEPDYLGVPGSAPPSDHRIPASGRWSTRAKTVASTLRRLGL